MTTGGTDRLFSQILGVSFKGDGVRRKGFLCMLRLTESAAHAEAAVCPLHRVTGTI